MARLPLIFVHLGNAPYLLYCLRQARVSNPGSEIVLIGDRSNRRYGEFLIHCLADRYMARAREFAAVYRHLSDHAVRTELIWYQRWFMIESYMRGHGLSEAFIADTDVMVYDDLAPHRQLFAEADVTLAQYRPGKVSGHYMFLNNLDALTAFCDFCMKLYTDPAELAGLERLYQDEFVKPGIEGGIGDMTALSLFRARSSWRIPDSAPVTGGVKFDQNIREDEGLFEMDGEHKRIVWRENRPYGCLLAGGAEVPFVLLHFNGRAKALMPSSFRGPPIPREWLRYAQAEAARAEQRRRLRKAVGGLLRKLRLRQVVTRLASVRRG